MLLTEEEVWQPLIRPDFLEGLWLRLEQLWAQLGFVPPEGAPNPNAALQQYAQAGQYPTGGEKTMPCPVHCACASTRASNCFDHDLCNKQTCASA